MQFKYGLLYEKYRPISLLVPEYTWKMQQALSGQWIQLGNSTHRTKCCGKCLTCFWVTRVRRTAREAGTAGVSVWTAGTWGREARGATHIHRLVLLCNKQNWSDDIQTLSLHTNRWSEFTRYCPRTTSERHSYIIVSANMQHYFTWNSLTWWLAAHITIQVCH